MGRCFYQFFDLFNVSILSTFLPFGFGELKKAAKSSQIHLFFF